MSHAFVGNGSRQLSGISRINRRPVRARTALSRVNGVLSAMIDAIATSKVRRAQRELALRGISAPPAPDQTAKK